MFNVNVAVACWLPDVPVTVTVELPIAAAPVAVRSIRDATVVPDRTAGVAVVLTPAGVPEIVRFTLPLNPPDGVSVAVTYVD